MHIVVDEIRVGDEVTYQYGKEGVITEITEQGRITIVVKLFYCGSMHDMQDVWTKRTVRGSG